MWPGLSSSLQCVLVLTHLLVLRCQHRQVPPHILCVVAGAALEQEEVVQVKTDIDAKADVVILIRIICILYQYQLLRFPHCCIMLLPHQWQCHKRLVRAHPGARVPQHVGAGPGLGSGYCLFLVPEWLSSPLGL